MIEKKFKYRAKRTFILPEFDKFQMTSGTENCYDLKSSWIHLCGQIKTDGEDQSNKTRIFLHNLKQSINESIKRFRFRSDFIFDPDFPDSYEWLNRGFYNIQINLYPQERMDYKKMNRIMTSFSYIINEAYEKTNCVKLEKWADYSIGKKTSSRKRPS